MNCPHGERLVEVLKNNGFVGKPIRGAEIGVRYGDMSEHMLQALPQLYLTLVDPYLPYTGTEKNNLTQAKQDEIKKQAHTRLYGWTPRTFWVYETSVKAAAGMLDREFDYVFIDACHTYEAVLEDIVAWYNKVKRPGIFAGHDWNMDGVQRAVREFAKFMDLHIHFDDRGNVSTWWIKV